MNSRLDREFEDRIEAAREFLAISERPPTIDMESIFRRIQDWRRSNPDQLRSDAAYFLMVNADLVIAGPLLSAGAPSYEIDNGLQNDLEMILNRVKDEPSEVSAHRMLDIIAEQWHQLRLTRSDLWD